MNLDAEGICNKCSQRPKLDFAETANLLKTGFCSFSVSYNKYCKLFGQFTDKWVVSQPSTESLNIKKILHVFVSKETFIARMNLGREEGNISIGHKARVLFAVQEFQQHLLILPQELKWGAWIISMLESLSFCGWMTQISIKNPHHSFSKLLNSVDSLVENISFQERRIFLFCKVNCPNLLKDDISPLS